MNLLQFLLIITGVVFFFFAIDFFQRKKFNALHFIVFFGGSLLILVFSLYPNLLDRFGSFFGVSRGADIIVYSSIIILFYLYFELMNVINRNKGKFTRLSRELSLQSRQGDLGDSKIAFVIPSYNEDEHAIEVVEDVLNEGYGIVYVDDGSKNYTFRKIKDKHLGKNIVFLRHAVNMGQGAALETGFEYVRRHGKNIEHVVTFDADGQHRLDDLANFFKEFKKDKDLEIVLGSRFLGSTENLPQIKKIVLKLGIIFTWMISGIKLTDTHNGYRVIRKDVLEKIRITMDGMEHASEVIDIIKEQKISYKEVPIRIIYSDYSINKGTGRSSKAFSVAAKMIYKKFFFK